MNENEVRLEAICEGAVPELFDQELQKVLRNIADVNTEATKARRITLTVILVPDEDRTVGKVYVEAASKLIPPKRHAATVYFGGAHGGRYVAVEHDPKQMGLEFESNLKPIPGGKDGA